MEEGTVVDVAVQLPTDTGRQNLTLTVNGAAIGTVTIVTLP